MRSTTDTASHSRIAKALVALVLIVGGMKVSADNKPEIHIRLGEPTFVMPQFADPFMERESGIAPHEYEMAEKLRGLLDTDSKQAALDELSGMLDLELSPALLHLKGQIYFTLEDYEGAENAFKNVLLRMPQFIRAHSDIGQLYLITDRLPEAREHFSKAVAYGERNPVIYGQLGYLNLKLHNAQSAIAAYQNALAIEPSNPQWQQGLLAALSSAKLYGPAVSFTHEMLAATPDNADLWLNKAFLHLQQDESFEALASLETALALGNADPENRLAAARLHLQQDSFERALGLLKVYIASESADLQLMNELAAWLESKNRWREMSELLGLFEAEGEIAAEDRGEYELLKARAARGMKNHAAAGRHYEAALAAAPADVDVLLSAASYYYSQKKLVEAESLYVRAESFDDAKKDALLGRARIYIDLKDYQSALDVLRQAQAAYPDTPELSRNIAILEKTLNTRRLEL